MERRLVVTLVVAACAATASAQPVQTYTRSPEPSRSEGLRSLRPFIPAGDPRPGLLITPAPYPDGRVDSPDRSENGRLWSSRSPIGNRSPMNELTRGLPGAASYGAPAEALDEVVWVQPSRVTTVIAISPWQEVDANTLRQVQRHEKNLGRTTGNPESAQLLSELRRAQHEWLREQGYILKVRTHINPAVTESDAEPAVQPTSVKPRGIIRVVPNPPAKIAGTAAASE